MFHFSSPSFAEGLLGTRDFSVVTLLWFLACLLVSKICEM